MIKNLDKNEAQKLLKEQKFGHLGCVLESGEPYVVPVNYLFKDDEIYIHCLPGQKLDALRANGKVCLQVEKIEILKEFSARFEHLTPVEAMIEEQWNLGGLVVFRLNIKRISGMAES